MDSLNLVKQMEEFLDSINFEELLDSTDGQSTILVEQNEPQQSSSTTPIMNQLPPPQPSFAHASLQNNTSNESSSTQPVSVSSSADASSSSDGVDGSGKKKKKRKHWQDWKDQMCDQLTQRGEDPNFVVKQCTKTPSKPKPYDKYINHYKLE